MIELKQGIGKESDISVHETEIAEDTSMKGVELGKEVETKEDTTKTVLIVTEEKDVLVHEIEIL